MLHIKLHARLYLVVHDISSRKSIFSLENVKILTTSKYFSNFYWTQECFWIYILTQSFDLVGEFPTTSRKRRGGTCWWNCIQSNPDNLEEEKAHNDELTWHLLLSKTVGELSIILRDTTRTLLKPLSFISDINWIMIFSLVLALLPQTLIK